MRMAQSLEDLNLAIQVLPELVVQASGFDRLDRDSCFGALSRDDGQLIKIDEL